MWFFGLIVVLLVGAVAVVASGRWGAMSTAYDDRPDMTVPARQALTSTDIESARFAVGVRGYRMDEVDTLLERVAKEVAERDRRIADLERAVAPIVESPEGHGFTSNPYTTPEIDDTGTQEPILVGGDFPDPAPEAADPMDRPAAADTSDQPTASTTVGNTPGTASPSTPEGDPAGAAGTAGGAAAGAASAAGTADAGTAGDSAAGGSEDGEAQAAGGAAAADDEPETRELPRASQAAADEYERLQAEARAVLEAQSQPVTPRRAPAPQQPQDEQPQATYQPSQDAYHQAAQKPSQAPLTPAQQYDQLKLNGQVQQQTGQEGEGAYQRPS